MTTRSRAITGCILAGGQGQRLAGADKGLVELGGRPLLLHVLARFQPQVDQLLISANRNHALYRRYCPRVVADTLGGYAGPLAGIAAAMTAATTPLLATTPCDSPFIPEQMVESLAQALAAAKAEIAVVRTGQQLQPVFALLDTRLRDSLLAYLDTGQRKIDTWYAAQDMVAVDFGAEASAFMNINTPADLQAAAAQLHNT